MKPVHVLMVCMGNICRSPTAEGVLRHKLKAAGLADGVSVDSAGTHAYHCGEPPDSRALRHALRRGYDLSSLRARQVADEDFQRFDLILAMDWDNLALLEAQAPAGSPARIRRLMEFAERDAGPVVPDPYTGSARGFDHVLDLVEAACDGLVNHLSMTNNRNPVGTS